MLHRALAATLTLSTALVLLASYRPARGDDGWQELFNGKDLSGWDGNPKFWSVENGAITARTTPENPTSGNTFLIWRGGTLKDFVLRIKFRIPKGNSGVQFRSKDLGNWVVSGYQADLDDADQYTGVLYEERGRGILAPVGQKSVVEPNGKPRPSGSLGDAMQLKSVIRKGDWNEYEISARGNHLTAALNGRITAEVRDEDPQRRATEGILALQLHSGEPMVVQFKDIRLKVLR